jgi:hypothetical protein
MLIDEPYDVAQTEPPLTAVGAVMGEPFSVRVPPNGGRADAE